MQCSTQSSSLRSRIASTIPRITGGSHGGAWVDLDNDGHPDLFLVTGSVYPEVERQLPAYPFKTPRLVFRNLGEGRFEELIEEAGDAIVSSPGEVHDPRGLAEAEVVITMLADDAAVRAADFCLIVSRPGILDLRSIGVNVEIAKLAGKPVAAVINAAPAQGGQAAAAAESVRKWHSVEVCPIIVHQRDHAPIPGGSPSAVSGTRRSTPSQKCSSTSARGSARTTP